MNVALYARVSTDKCEVCGKNPASHEGPATRILTKSHEFRGQDPAVQLLELRAWCSAQKHTIVEEYVDRGVSGTKASRPQLDRLMADATKGLRDIQVVAVLRLDRFGRSVQHLHVAVGKLLGAKVEFISVKDGFDLTTPMGKLLFGILATFAEFERNVIAERTKDGLKKVILTFPTHRKGNELPASRFLWNVRKHQQLTRDWKHKLGRKMGSFRQNTSVSH